jgi:hypothetical protein
VGGETRKASSSTFVETLVNDFASFKRRRAAYLIQLELAMRYVDDLHDKGKLLSRAFLEAVPVLSVCEYSSVYRETISRLFQLVLLSSYVGHCKIKGAVLREEEEGSLAEGKTGDERQRRRGTDTSGADHMDP